MPAIYLHSGSCERSIFFPLRWEACWGLSPTPQLHFCMICWSVVWGDLYLDLAQMDCVMGVLGNIYDACAIATAALGFRFPVSKTGRDSGRDSQWFKSEGSRHCYSCGACDEWKHLQQEGKKMWNKTRRIKNDRFKAILPNISQFTLWGKNFAILILRDFMNCHAKFDWIMV